MATARRQTFRLAPATGPSGEVWTASPGEGRPAVVLYGRCEAPSPDVGARAAARLARAGLTAVCCAMAADAERHAGADLAALCAALANGDLVPGLAPPARIVVLGYGDGVAPARVYAARQKAELVVTWRLTVGDVGGDCVEAEVIASGSHVLEHSLQLDEALDRLLAWLARVT